VNRHDFDPISAVFGLLFAILGFRFLSGEVTLASLDLSWLWPLAAVALGLALLITARRPDAPANRDIYQDEGGAPREGPER
jgi:hypothetical protein